MGWEFSKQWKDVNDVLTYLQHERFDGEVVILSQAAITNEAGMCIRWQAILHRGHSHVICDLLALDRGCWG